MPRAARARAGRLRAGWEARSRVWRVQGVVWRARWRSGGSGSRWWPGWLWCGHACRVFDAWSAGSATASAGRVRGLEQGGRVGEHLGSKGQLQDMLGNLFAAGLDKVDMVVAISMP